MTADHVSKSESLFKSWSGIFIISSCFQDIEKCLSCDSWASVENRVFVYLKVNALSELIIGIYLHGFTNKERGISIYRSRQPLAVLKIEYTEKKNSSKFESANAIFAWYTDSCVLNLHHGYYTAIMTSRRLFHHNPVSRGKNHPIGKSEFLQCMNVE